MPNIIYRSNDNIVVVRGVSTIDQNGKTVYLTATDVVQLSLRVNGALVHGETWPIALTYIAGSNGDFQANLKDTLTLPFAEVVGEELIFDNGADQRGALAISINIQTSNT